ncbi:hypothetical protein KIN20_033718 [Parelaphostrongylus tenuis]|uniref:Uncharacterized protein n=1 Tax=Parelaphostrongylus tenuis TaxID=148309 RepID=A0AAD5WIN5_PARTN|nr:hypothetical protein KIN20_033718 [Parelaphostrongylus tenuis]
MAVVVFGTAKAALKLDSPDDFDISKFMLENDLADDLIGLSLVIVGSDAFAIERQRLRGNIDNCHSLLKNKLMRHPPAYALTRLPLDELNSWLTVSVKQPPLDVNVCCQSVRQNEATIYFDPLGAATISALSTLQPPAVNSARIPIESPSYISYHRQTRTQIALLDKLYSLVAIDGTTSMLHWMVVDIPAQELASSANGITKASYIPFVPLTPATCSPFALFLFSQPASINVIPTFCDDLCDLREKFRIEMFKQRYMLRLRALSWISVCYDLPYSYHVLKAATNSSLNSTLKGKTSVSKTAASASSFICAMFHVSNHHNCPLSTSTTVTAIVPFLLAMSLLLIDIY